MAQAFSHQPTLFGQGPPAVDRAALARVRRQALDEEAWVEHLPGWVTGHDALMEALARTTAWRQERRVMYDRMVDVPRLVAALPADSVAWHGDTTARDLPQAVVATFLSASRAASCCGPAQAGGRWHSRSAGATCS